MKEEKILVLCVDRDGDIKKQVGEKGPIYGREQTIDVAVKLAVKDPSESDANALFGAVSILDELLKEGKGAEVAAVTGSENVGVESDIIISKEVDAVIEKLNPSGVIVVTDGAEDESILPIIQSRVKIISIKRVIVRQSEKLESTYYAIQHFLKEVISDPKLSRIIVGLPAIALILYAFFGGAGWRLIVGVIGSFLVVKGFGLEGDVRRFYEEFRASFTTGRVGFFFYAVAVIIGLVGILSGVNVVNDAGISYGDYTNSLPSFIQGSIALLSFAAVVAIVGRAVDSFVEGRGILHYVFLLVLVFGVGLMAEALSRFIQGGMSPMDFSIKITQVLILSILVFLSIRTLRKMEVSV